MDFYELSGSSIERYHRQHMLPTGISNTVISLTCIPNLLLHQITHLVLGYFGPVVVTNCYWH